MFVLGQLWREYERARTHVSAAKTCVERLALRRAAEDALDRYFEAVEAVLPSCRWHIDGTHFRLITPHASPRRAV